MNNERVNKEGGKGERARDGERMREKEIERNYIAGKVASDLAPTRRTERLVIGAWKIFRMP